MRDAVSVVAAVVVPVLLEAVLFWAVVTHRLRTRAMVVIRHLQRRGIYMVKVGPLATLWTPDRPPTGRRLTMGFGQMLGRGTARYYLDSDTDTVDLHWQPKRGEPREWVGRIPLVATASFQNPYRRAIATALGLFLVIGGAGAGIGAASGAVVPGIVAGLVIGYFAGVTVWTSAMQRGVKAALVESGRDQENPCQP